MLIGNPADFDRIRARYEALRYPTPEQAAFNATRASYEGLLTGSGYDTMMVPTTTPGQGVTFSVDPVTGQVITNVPQYEAPVYETIYDRGEGLIGADGRPIPDETIPGMGQSIPVQRGGDGRENLARMNAMRDRQARKDELAENLDRFNMLPSYKESKLPGLLGFFDETVSNFSREQQLNNIMRDIDRMTSFEQDIKDSSYTGSGGTDDSGGQEPDTGPSGDDDALGKGIPGLGPQNGGNGTGNGAAGGCFVKGTMIEMADGTTKEITTIKVGEETKGGTVQAKMEFMPQNIYNYKDVLVSGSHWVIEDNQFIAVEDSKHGVLTDRIEPVYTFKTSNNRIWINNIEFGDFETGSDDDWEPHFEAVRQKLNKELRNV